MLQFFVAFSWLASRRNNFLCLDLSAVSFGQFLVATILFAFGQSLNAGIYKAIGKAGVYYGFKLGHHIPWHTGKARLGLGLGLGARLGHRIPWHTGKALRHVANTIAEALRRAQSCNFWVLEACSWEKSTLLDCFKGCGSCDVACHRPTMLCELCKCAIEVACLKLLNALSDSDPAQACRWMWQGH